MSISIMSGRCVLENYCLIGLQTLDPEVNVGERVPEVSSTIEWSSLCSLVPSEDVVALIFKFEYL
jgi:hypothetical protein